MRNLFPEIEPYKVHNLKVSDIHTLYVEESGNPDGIPVIHLHGGPGSWAKPKKRKLYDPEKYRIILFDQRGCGRSTPQGETRENTTWDLVEDMEKIRTELQIEKWHILGGSWGSTLALAYAETHPERVTALILQGIFTYRKEEKDWLNEFKAGVFFPEVYEEIVNSVPDEAKSDPMPFIQDKISNGTKEESEKYSLLLDKWEFHVGELIPEIEEEATEKIVQSNLVYNHYDQNNGFLEEGQLIRDVGKIRQIPAVIIHGRYDMTVSLKNAWDLHKAWPEASFEIIPGAGHSSSEPGTLEKILEYLEKFSQL